MTRLKFQVGDVVRGRGVIDRNPKMDEVRGVIEIVDRLLDPLPYVVRFDKDISGWGIGGRRWRCGTRNLDLVKAASSEKKRWNKAW